MSSDSSDEDLSQLREAIDVTLFNNDMFKPPKSSNRDKIIEKQKSNRHLTVGNQVRDVQVSSDMQTRIGEKISNIIWNKIEFVDVEKENTAESESPVENEIRLFSDSVNAVCDEHPTEKVIQKRKKIKKRKIDDDAEVDKKDAFLAASVSPKMILEQHGTEFWKSRRKPKLYEYKKNKNNKTLELIENNV